MIFLSMLLQKTVYDNSQKQIGTLADLCVSLHETFPVVTALVIYAAGSPTPRVVPWDQVDTIEELPIHLNCDASRLATYTPGEDELLLKRDLLDKQIVDTQGFRVVKVNDLKLAQIKRTARLIGADIGFSGILRRLGLLKTIETLSGAFSLRMPEKMITWNYVEPIQSVQPTGQLALAAGLGISGVIPKVQLNVSYTKLPDLHPADFADILEQLDVEDASAMLNQLDTDAAADVFGEVEPTMQFDILTGLGLQKASDLLERLSPDDAADILAEVSEARAEELLNLMPIEDAAPIRQLLRYDAQTAGGLMTTEFIALPQNTTVEEALTYLRTNSQHLEMVYYLYVMDAHQHLQGVVSLRQLVTAEPGVSLGDLMDKEVISVYTDTDQEEVARVIAKYDLVGVPVIERDDRLVGLITVDDVIDVIHEEQAEDFSELAGADVEEAKAEESFSLKMAFQRFPWLALNTGAGFVLAYGIFHLFQPVFQGGALDHSPSRLAMNSILCFLPMLLLTSGQAGTQALGIAGWSLRSERGFALWRGFVRELQLGTVAGLLTSILVGIGAWLLFQSLGVTLILGLGFGFTLLIASICGLVLPNLLQRFRLRGSLLSGPFLDPIIAIISVVSFCVLAFPLLGEFQL